MDRKILIQTITDPTTTGIFHQLASDEYFSFIDDDNKDTLDIDYYLSHSGNKYISNLYNNLIEKYPDDDPLIQLSKIIKNRYEDKWTKIYNALIESDYDPLENYSSTETETPNLTDHRITKVDQLITNTADNKDYGFNSNSAVPTSYNVNTLSSDGDDNKTDETIAHTGTRTLVKSGNIGVTTSQQMLESEIKLRALYNMRDIIFGDIDRVLCLSIY